MIQTAALMSKLNKEEIPLSRVELLGDFPISVAKDRTTVIGLQWDYAAWTPALPEPVAKLKNSQLNLRGMSACWLLSVARSRRGSVRNWKRAGSR
jgi:hypothetical protein